MYRLAPSILHRSCRLLVAVAGYATAVQTSPAELITYGWTYSRGGIDLVHGTLDAQGVDSLSFLEEISNVGMEVRTTGELWTSKLAVEGVSGWFSPLPRIPANGTTAGIELHFTASNGGFPAEFLLFNYPGFGAPYHSDVIFTDAECNVRSRMAESLSSPEWRLWKIPDGATAIVPDGGSTLTLLVVPVTACLLGHRRVRQRLVKLEG